MKKLHAFLICSIIGCATSSLWGAENNRSTSRNNRSAAREPWVMEKRPGDFFSKHNSELSNLNRYKNMRDIALTHLEATQEQTRAIREQTELAKAQLKETQKTNALLKSLLECFPQQPDQSRLHLPDTVELNNE